MSHRTPQRSHFGLGPTVPWDIFLEVEDHTIGRISEDCLGPIDKGYIESQVPAMCKSTAGGKIPPSRLMLPIADAHSHVLPQQVCTQLAESVAARKEWPVVQGILFPKVGRKSLSIALIQYSVGTQIFSQYQVQLTCCPLVDKPTNMQRMSEPHGNFIRV